MMECVPITSTCYHTRYCTFSLGLVWFGGYLQPITMCHRQFKKKHINVHLLDKSDSNA